MHSDVLVKHMHCGKGNDRGTGILLKCRGQKDEVHIVVQVKLGKHFSGGNRNQIVLQLVGSCVLK